MMKPNGDDHTLERPHIPNGADAFKDPTSLIARSFGMLKDVAGYYWKGYAIKPPQSCPWGYDLTSNRITIPKLLEPPLGALKRSGRWRALALMIEL